MKVYNIWQNEDWTIQARRILNSIKDFPEDSKIILIVRHSHRDDSDDAWKVSRLPLTPLGHEIAEIFGKELPKDRPIRLFYSRLERCKETADDILKGFLSISGEGTIKESINTLYDLGISANNFFNEVTKYPYTQFIYRWVAGLYPPNLIIPFEEYSRSAAYEIWSKIGNAPKRGIDLHVSHDLIILCFRLGWFGLSPTDRWPSFLDGFAFTLQDDHILLSDNGKFKEIEIPHWWQKRE